jgi:hypothetical protein
MFYKLPLVCDAYSGLFGCRSEIGFIDLRILRPDPKMARSADSTSLKMIFRAQGKVVGFGSIWESRGNLEL